MGQISPVVFAAQQPVITRSAMRSPQFEATRGSSVRFQASSSRTLFSVLAALMGISLAGCGGEDAQQTVDPQLQSARDARDTVVLGTYHALSQTDDVPNDTQQTDYPYASREKLEALQASLVAQVTPEDEEGQVLVESVNSLLGLESIVSRYKHEATAVRNNKKMLYQEGLPSPTQLKMLLGKAQQWVTHAPKTAENGLTAEKKAQLAANLNTLSTQFVPLYEQRYQALAASMDADPKNWGERGSGWLETGWFQERAATSKEVRAQAVASMATLAVGLSLGLALVAVATSGSSSQSGKRKQQPA